LRQYLDLGHGQASLQLNVVLPLDRSNQAGSTGVILAAGHLQMPANDSDRRDPKGSRV